jgi:Flp pilus assembly protein TadD
MFRQAIKLNPTHPKFYNNLGMVLEKANLLSQAAELFGWAIKLNPDYTEALNNFGTILIRTNQFDEAVDYFRRAIELNPRYAKAYNNLGLVFENTNRRDEALRCLRRAIELEPDNAAFYNNLGKLLKDARQLDDAEVCFQQALKFRPDFVDADFALAILYLLQEQYEKGWEKYDDLRLIKEGNKYLPIPHWRGENLTNCRILLYADQGFGDTIHFSRYAQMVGNLAGETNLLVQKPLERLLEFSLTNCQIRNSDSIVAKKFDFACPLLSLPHIFHTSRDTIPQLIPYLQPNRASVEAWHKKLHKIDRGTRYRIGVVWAGNPAHNNDRNRSIPFDVFGSLFDITEVSWVSLQVGKRRDDLTRTPDKVIDISGDLVDFAETAGVIANLDLVITVDSAVAHLAGAMGRKTWLLLPTNPDWRWQLDREDSPWYPTLYLFRQREMGNWSEVLARVKESLAKLLLERSAARS